MAFYSLSLTWIVLATIPLYAALSLFITPILRKRLEEKFKYGAANTAFLTETVTGIQTVKSMAVEPQMQRTWEDQLANYVHSSFRCQNLNNIASQITGTINKLMTLGNVSFDHIRFRYRPDGPVILDDISLDVRAGEVIGIVGRSGSGKSTLTKLVKRLYVPEGGRVLIDGVDLTMVDTGWLRRNIGVVMQENFLFNRSIRNNIALTNPGTPMEQVVAAARMAGAHEFIVDLQEGYDTLVGEQGSNLSGSQRQRMAIARALITNPRILIFDEATSALDYESERIIQDNMAAIAHGRTVFIIAHRLSTVRQSHRIIVMEKGRIVEQGTHDGLLDANGYYAKLHSYQNHTPTLKPVVTAPIG